MKKILFILALLISFKSFGQIEDLESYTHRGKLETQVGIGSLKNQKFSKSNILKFDEYRKLAYKNSSDGNYNEAINYATKALNIKPKTFNCKFGCVGGSRVSLLFLRARLLTSIGNYSAALADYGEVIKFRKSITIVYSDGSSNGGHLFSPYLLRGNLLSLMGKNELACYDWKNAEKYFKVADENSRPNSSDKTIITYGKSGNAYFLTEEMTYEKVVDIINNNCADDMHIIKNDYEADKYLQSGVDKANRLKDYYGAIADYTKAIELVPNDALAYYNRGLSKDILGDISGAMADYNKAIELDPNDADFYSNRGGIKLDLEDYYGAISDYSKVIELNPNDADAYYNRGISKFDLGDYYGAINDYSKAIELDTDNADAYYNRGLSKKLLGDLNGACKDAKIAVSLGYIVEWMSECN